MTTESTIETAPPDTPAAPPIYKTAHTTWTELGAVLNAAATEGYHIAHEIIDRGGNAITLVLRRQAQLETFNALRPIFERALAEAPAVLLDLSNGKRINELDILKRIMGTEEVGLAVVKNITDAPARAPVDEPAPATEEYEHPTP